MAGTKFSDYLGLNYHKQAWKLLAIKGEPKLSILWEVRQIHLKQDSKELSPRPLANAPNTFNSKNFVKLSIFKGS